LAVLIEQVAHAEQTSGFRLLTGIDPALHLSRPGQGFRLCPKGLRLRSMILAPDLCAPPVPDLQDARHL
jgi:hypothetical protein